MSRMKYFLDPIFQNNDDDPRSHVLDPEKTNENITANLYELIQKHPVLVIIIIQISMALLLFAIGIKTMYYPKIEGVI